MLKPVSYYVREVRRHLPAAVFEPVPTRLVWLGLHVGIAALGIWAVAAAGLPWWAKLLLAVPIGGAYAGMAFVAHEVLHGAVVRSMTGRRVAGWLAFLPFCIGPRHWIGWHNRLHHGNTMIPGVDPDSYPTLEHYRTTLRTRVADRLSFGGGRILGAMTLLVGLVGQSLGVLFSSGPRAGYLAPREHALALAETAVDVLFWVGLGVWLGADVLFFGWVLPITVGSVVVMMHIITNHSLSPQTEVNDPLVNSLSVTVPRWFSVYTLQFGLHVEHHLFPSVSSRHAGRIGELLRQHWPDRYRSLPMGRALLRLFTTGRIYKNATTLFDPSTGRESPTL